MVYVGPRGHAALSVPGHTQNWELIRTQHIELGTGLYSEISAEISIHSSVGIRIGRAGVQAVHSTPERGQN